MERKAIVGIMGPGESASDQDIQCAMSAGEIIARNQWILLTGGRPAGVMEAAMKGAKAAGGLTLGILPGTTSDEASAFVDIPINTGLGQGRNMINILTADVVLAIGIGPGTASEISLAIKHDKPVVLVGPNENTQRFFEQFAYPKLHSIYDLKELPEIIIAGIESEV